MNKRPRVLLNFRSWVPICISAILILSSHFLATWMFSPKLPSEYRIDNPVRMVSEFDEVEFARVKRRVDQIWDRIEGHLQKHSKKELGKLRKGAALADIERFEEMTGFPLPYDVRASLLRHNGSSGNQVPCGFLMLNSVYRISQRYRSDVGQLTCLAEFSPEHWSTKQGRPWVSRVPVGDTGFEWEVVVECGSDNVFARLSSATATPIAEDWETVLTAWAEALENKQYELRDDGMISIPQMAGLYWW